MIFPNTLDILSLFVVVYAVLFFIDYRKEVKKKNGKKKGADSISSEKAETEQGSLVLFSIDEIKKYMKKLTRD